ncbi:gastrin isoform X1 [Lontra canadensis]|uniref:gastrin isoform X1 n=2 Tax=Lontra canadensis TaxID=76717 RepID=UPI0013F38EEE|nr:gastrin isoform X1 [Lontra canadensis]
MKVGNEERGQGLGAGGVGRNWRSKLRDSPQPHTAWYLPAGRDLESIWSRPVPLGASMAPSCSSAPLSFADKMQRLCVCVLILALALATFSEAAWKPGSRQQDAPSGPGANRGLEPHWLDRLGAAPHQRRQLGLQGPPQLVADLSKKQGPWVEEEEAAYGWMDFGRRSAEEGDQHP